MSDKDCLFCKIIAGEIPSEKVYEDDATYAFKDINPKAKVHVLIVPRKHYSNSTVRRRAVSPNSPKRIRHSSPTWPKWRRKSPTRSSMAPSV